MVLLPLFSLDWCTNALKKRRLLKLQQSIIMSLVAAHVENTFISFEDMPSFPNHVLIKRATLK